MKIFVKVKPNSNKNNVEYIDAMHYVVSVTVPPVQGRANAVVLDLLAEYLKMPKSLFTIKRGAKTKQKTIEIITNRELL